MKNANNDDDDDKNKRHKSEHHTRFCVSKSRNASGYINWIVGRTEETIHLGTTHIDISWKRWYVKDGTKNVEVNELNEGTSF